MNEFVKAEKAFDKVKIQALIQGSVFITTVGFNLSVTFDPKYPTAGTNGTDIIINPDFFLDLTKDERLFLYLHEIYHVVFMHMIRGENKNHEKYNQAADYVINILLRDAGYKMPKGGLVATKYRDWSTEQVYDDIPDPPEGYDCDIIVPGKGEAKTRGGKELQQNIENLVLKAMTASDQNKDAAGTIPSEIKRAMQELINPVLPWRELLERFMTSHAKDDYSYRRPNRRFMNEDMYIPSLYSEAMGEIHVAIDVSCSVTPEEFAIFLSEVCYIHETMNYSKLKIITFDTQIQTIDTIEDTSDILSIEFVDGGGTDLGWMKKYVKKAHPKVLIVFSDMEVHIPKKKPDTEVLWICVNNPSCTAPWGQLIHYKT